MISNSKKMKSVIVVGIVVAALLMTASAQDDQVSEAQSRATNVANKAMEGVKKGANKAAQVVEKSADGITVRVDRFVNPPAHQPGQSNLLISAGRGVGRLVRNYTVEAGRAIGSVGSAATNLVKNTSRATVNAAKETASRVSSLRRRPVAAKTE